MPNEIEKDFNELESTERNEIYRLSFICIGRTLNVMKKFQR